MCLYFAAWYGHDGRFAALNPTARDKEIDLFD